MPNPWFRMYAEFISDPKVQMMTETMQRRFVMLMGMRCSNDCETFHETEVAFVLRISDEEVAATRQLFVSKGFIDENWQLLNWDKRQFVSDSSTERVKRFRDRHKPQAVAATPEAKTDETERNVSVTPPEQNRTDAEQIQKKQNLPSGKRSAALEPDARHVACRDQVHAYWHHRHPAEPAAMWDGSEGHALDRLLKAKPDLTPDRFRQLLACRERSEVNHDERPRAWLERLTDYAGGPLDRFKLPASSAPRPDAALGMYLAPNPEGSPKPPTLEERQCAEDLLRRRKVAQLDPNAEVWLESFNAKLKAFGEHIRPTAVSA